MRAHMTAGKKKVKPVRRNKNSPSKAVLLRQARKDLSGAQGEVATLKGEVVRWKENHAEEMKAVGVQLTTIKDLRGLLATRDEELRIAKVCIDDLNKALAGEQVESLRFRTVVGEQERRIKLLEECLVDVSSLGDVATVVLTDMYGVAGMLEMLRAKALEMNFVFNPGPTAQNILLTSSAVSYLGLLDAFFQKTSEEAKTKKA